MNNTLCARDSFNGRRKSRISGSTPLIKNANITSTCSPKLYKICHIYTLQFVFHFMQKTIKHAISRRNRRKILSKILEKKMILWAPFTFLFNNFINNHSIFYIET
jgi:hypothetical protein